MTEKAKKLNFALDADLVPWADWAASLHGESVTRYINRAIRNDMERADEQTRAAFEAFMALRERA